MITRIAQDNKGHWYINRTDLQFDSYKEALNYANNFESYNTLLEMLRFSAIGFDASGEQEELSLDYNEWIFVKDLKAATLLQAWSYLAVDTYKADYPLNLDLSYDRPILLHRDGDDWNDCGEAIIKIFKSLPNISKSLM